MWVQLKENDNAECFDQLPSKYIHKALHPSSEVVIPHQTNQDESQPLCFAICETASKTSTALGASNFISPKASLQALKP